MARGGNDRRRPMLEPLESRFVFSGDWPINTIGTSTGTVPQPREIDSASVTVESRNLTVGKHATLFGVFVQPDPGSDLVPRIVAVKESNGQKVPLQPGRPYVPGRTSEAAAFVKVDRPGPLTVLVAGEHHTTGSFTYAATLAGDVNGDGVVNLSDLPLFAAAYGSTAGQPAYNAAADFNLNGVINLYDAKAIEHNMTPLTPEHSLTAVVNLLPSDQAHYPASQNSGGATFKQDVTIVGHTTPGSLVIEGTEIYPTNAQGFFFINVTNTSGINQNNLIILDPFGHQLYRDFPIFWIPFAEPGSKLNPK
jgi:Dockerin type I domain